MQSCLYCIVYYGNRQSVTLMGHCYVNHMHRGFRENIDVYIAILLE